jgi:hypothetical protein
MSLVPPDIDCIEDPFDTPLDIKVEELGLLILSWNALVL